MSSSDYLFILVPLYMLAALSCQIRDHAERAANALERLEQHAAQCEKSAPPTARP